MHSAETAINIRHLRAFCEVAAAGSISSASERVFLSQPAITQAIAGIERQLDVQLFNRKPDGMYLTDAGNLLQTRASRALRYFETGARGAARIGGRRSGFKDFARLLTNAQLRTLLAISDTGNFTWAARNQGVTRPSLHRAARDLERLSGMVFYRKTRQGFELTPAAQELARHARLAFAEMRQALAEINSWKGHDASELVVGTLPLARSYLLPKAINELTRLRPGVRVSVLDGPYRDLLHGLRHGELDMLIGALRDPPPVDDVVQFELFRDELAIVSRSGHPLTKLKRPGILDLAAYPWVVPAPGIPTRDHFDALFRNAALSAPENLIETSSLILVRELLLGSDRLTIISGHQIHHEVEHGLLRYLDFDLGPTARPIGITTRHDWQPTATQTLLQNLLSEASHGRPEREAMNAEQRQ